MFFNHLLSGMILQVGNWEPSGIKSWAMKRAFTLGYFRIF